MPLRHRGAPCKKCGHQIYVVDDQGSQCDGCGIPEFAPDFVASLGDKLLEQLEDDDNADRFVTFFLAYAPLLGQDVQEESDATGWLSGLGLLSRPSPPTDPGATWQTPLGRAVASYIARKA